MAKTTKRRQKVQMPAGIRNKMMAAVSMLMVSAIMMVSSTYAWFTLSTAPEVTGITTNVGANGNLEMMLLSGVIKDGMEVSTYRSTDPNLGIESEIGDSMAAANANILESNETWGNLVDLSSSSYGLSSIILSPAKLNATSVDAKTTINVSPLLGPSYGSDGRVISVDKLTYAGKYANGAWTVDDTHAGVRAIGMSSGATVRVSVYNSALRSAKDDAETARVKADQSLSDNAQTLATLLVDKAQGATSFKNTYKTHLKSIIDGVTEANKYVASAIKNATLAYCVSAANENNLTDDQVGDISDAIKAKSLSELAAYTKTTTGKELPTSIANAITAYDDIAEALQHATNKYNDNIANETGDLTWENINSVLSYLANQDYMKIGDEFVFGADKDEIIEAVLGTSDPDAAIDTDKINVNIKMFETTGLTVNGKNLPAGDAGVYFKIAKICGQEIVSGKVKVEYGITVNVPFTMVREIDNNSVYMTLAIRDINTAGAPETTVGGEGTTVTLNDPMGYMLDFGFRTNATNSHLMLQTEKAQRVYNSEINQSVAESTQGGGSYMQFTSTNVSTFSIDEMCALMSTIRVAFIQPQFDTNGTSSYTLLAMGALDCPTVEEGGTITYPDGSKSASTANGAEDTLKLNLNLYNFTTEEDSLNEGKVNIELGEKLTKQDIIALEQNKAAKVSVLVYLDGELVDNTMVASAAQSMYGSLNLQFSSDATLVPMDNNGMFGGGTSIIASGTEFEQWKTAGETGSIGDYEGTVLPGVTLYKGKIGNEYDGEIYYSINNGPKYLLTTSNYMYALDVQINSGGDNPSGEQTSMTLSASTLTLTVGDGTETLSVTGAPADANIVWASADSTIVSVGESTGVVTPVTAGGPVNITATINGTTTLTCAVTVTAAE